MHTFCENIVKICINLPCRTNFGGHISPLPATLTDTEYSIFIKQNKKIIIIIPLKTVSLYILFKISSEICSNPFIMNGRRNIDLDTSTSAWVRD